jgi:hypothetical protein
MIKIPDGYKCSLVTDKKFKELVNFFNELEVKLEYPNCENDQDVIQTLRKAQDELDDWGVL